VVAVKEQRTATRVDINVRFFVHVRESEDEPDMVGLSLECKAIDFSPCGMQFLTNSILSPGALVLRHRLSPSSHPLPLMMNTNQD
jgi:hypothetical protein